MSFPCNIYVLGLVLSTITASVVFTFSLLNTVAMEELDCLENPEVLFINSNYSDDMFNVISDAISNSSKRLTIASSVLIDPDVVSKFVLAIKKSPLKPEDIHIMLPESANTEACFKEIGVNIEYTISTVKNKPSFGFIVADDRAFMVPNVGEKTNINDRKTLEVVDFHQCRAAAEDINSFIDFYISDEKDKISPNIIIPSNLQAKTSAIKPANTNRSDFFFFHNPDYYTMPLRISSPNILNTAFKNQPQEIIIFTKFPPLLASYSWTDPSAFSFYFNIKATLYNSSTKIKMLVDNTTIANENLGIWLKEFELFKPQLEIRKYPPFSDGPNFIIFDNISMLFSHGIKSHDINEFVSLHYATNDIEVKKSLLNFFNDVWEDI